MKFIIPIFCLFVNYLVAQELSPPNIVLINVDDLGWRDVGFMGSKYYETPHLDSLSSQGVVFTNGYAAAANCAPSRASLMTGLWPTRHGISYPWLGRTPAPDSPPQSPPTFQTPVC